MAFLIALAKRLFTKKEYDPQMRQLYHNIVQYELKTII